MQLFYSNQIEDNFIVLPSSDSKHCVKTLRYSVGDTVHVVDGNGNHYTATLLEDDINKCILKIININSNFDNRKHYIHIAIAPTKSHDRLEWFVEKAVEIGVDEITFLQCNNSERKRLRMDRIEKIAITAMKQTLKATLPIIHKIIDFNLFIQENTKDADLYIAHLKDGKRTLLKSIKSRFSASVILIGPEGDFSPEEIKNAVNQNYKPISLGNSRFRTETAGIVACHTLNLKYES